MSLNNHKNKKLVGLFVASMLAIPVTGCNVNTPDPNKGSKVDCSDKSKRESKECKESNGSRIGKSGGSSYHDTHDDSYKKGIGSKSGGTTG